MFVMIALTGVVWLSQSLKYLDFIVNKGLSFLSFARLTMLLVPTVLAVILPVAAFTAVLYVFNRLMTDRELIVLRAAGLSQWSLAFPAMLMVIVVTIFGYAINLYLMPAGFRTFKDEQSVLRADYSQILLQEGVFNNVTSGMTVYVRSHESDGEIRGILVHDSREPTATITMMAESGALVSSDNGLYFLLVNGNRQEVSEDSEQISMLYFDRYTLDLSNLTKEPDARYREPRERYLHELIGPPISVSDDQNRAELTAEFHRRLISPLSAPALVMIALACLLTGEFDRRRQWPRLVTGVALMLFYIAGSFALGNALVKSPQLLPVYYAYPFVIFSLACIAIQRQKLPRWVRLPSLPAREA